MAQRTSLLFSLIAAATLALSAPAAHAANGVIDVEGVDSFFELGEGNSVLYATMDPFAEVVAISWNVNVTAFEPSWLSELSFSATDLNLTAGVLVAIADSDEFSGTQSYTGRLDLRDQGLAFRVGDDGVVRVEFYEFFNDRDVTPDGRWNYGTLTFETAAPIPEPSSMLLMALGIAGLGTLAARRRRPAPANLSVTPAA
jgi:hypothetical protein